VPEGASSLFSQSEEIEVLRSDFSVLTEGQGERAGEGVDEELKELVLMSSVVCLLVRLHTISKRTFQLTSFARY
jgi:hypothetical protein